ncbi:MAG: glycosyltransferase family 4 protein [Lentisphaerae bacterium]|nr:glycosyltransferase family 4 protein [Lentisphaerota bacterium]
MPHLGGLPRTMKVGIDARWIFPQISGIGAYTRSLLRALVRRAPDIEFVVFFDNEHVLQRTTQRAGLNEVSNVTLRMLPYGVFSLQGQGRLPPALRREGLDVYHTPNYLVPFLAFPRHRPGKIRCVATIHDVIPLVMPDHAPKAKKTRILPLFRGIMQEVGARADAVITVSETSRRDVIRHLRIRPQAEAKVRVVYNGVGEAFRQPADGRMFKANGPRTLLYVGRADPYKNLPTLVTALARVRDTLPFPVNLTVAGSPDPRYPEAARLARELGVHERVKWTGYLPEEDLVHYYQQADLLVHPSRYEGFGLQILEAMACGLPVVSSNAASLPEVAGDAALLVDPDDVDAYADRIRRVLTEPDLWNSLSRKGLDRAAQFTWQRAADETLAVYNSL